MYLIGLVEFHAEDSDEVFSKVGETTFNQEVAKKVMAKQMKQVKREMVNAVMEGTSNLTSKIPTSMVKMVTLLLLQPVAFGGEGTDGQEEKNEQYTKAGGWEGYVMVIAYSLLVFAFGICCGYVYRLRVGIFLRTLARFVRQERIMELQREQDHQEALRDYRGYRGLVMRTMVNRDGGGEWQQAPRPPWPEPLKREDADPDRILNVQMREGGVMANDAPADANSRQEQPEPEEEEFEPGDHLLAPLPLLLHQLLSQNLSFCTFSSGFLQAFEESILHHCRHHLNHLAAYSSAFFPHLGSNPSPCSLLLLAPLKKDHLARLIGVTHQ